MGQTSKTSARIRCFTLKCVPPPRSLVFAHYFFMGWFSVSDSNLWAQESWAPGEPERDVCVLSAQLSARTDIRNIPSNPGDTSVGSSGASFSSVCSIACFFSSFLSRLYQIIVKVKICEIVSAADTLEQLRIIL